MLILQQDLKMTPLAKGLSLQLQSIQKQYNRLFSKGEIPQKIMNNQTITERHLMRWDFSLLLFQNMA
ncbi:hypothetical protein CN488_29745, partial [Bacillus anthracis]